MAVLEALDCSIAMAENIVPCINTFDPGQVQTDREIPEVADDNASAILLNARNQIMLALSMSRRVELRKSPYVVNACASRDPVSGQQVIYYNMTWLKDLILSENEWALVFALAHEMGHHFNDHTANDNLGGHLREFEADRFAGRAILELEGDIEQALVIFDDYPYEGSESHPARKIRIAAAMMGYGDDDEARELLPSLEALLDRADNTSSQLITGNFGAEVELLFSENRDERLFAFSNLAAFNDTEGTLIAEMSMMAQQNPENFNGVFNVLSFINSQASISSIEAASVEVVQLLTDEQIIDNGERTEALVDEIAATIADSPVFYQAVEEFTIENLQ